MSPTRRLVVGAGLTAPFLPRFAKAAEFEWRLGHTAPESFPLHKQMLQAAEEIAKASDGRVAFKVIPDSQLGGQLGLMAQVRAGSVEATPIIGQALAGVLGPVFVQSVGFGFAGYPQLWPAMDGELGKALRFQFQERLSLVAMEKVWDFGFRQVTTRKKPIVTAADLVGLKIRTPVDEELVGMFRALKAAPLAMNLQDLIPAMQAGAVDAQDGILPLVQAAGLDQQQGFCSMTNHSWDGQWLCFNNRAWLRLPDKLKDVVATAFNQAALRQRTDVAADEAAAKADLTGKGMVFNTPDPASFRAALRSAGYYEKAQKRVGDALWGLLEKYAGRLA